ncbi:MAG: UDP-N-acetylmuramoyl-L-alanine--D-glutamate ligase, partial [Pseudomonadota bacterium]
MIPVRVYPGRRVGVLGLGRSGLAAARALRAGDAVPVCWDDGEAARAAAAAEGFAVEDLARAEGLAVLVVSPGIAALHPAPLGPREILDREPLGRRCRARRLAVVPADRHG